MTREERKIYQLGVFVAAILIIAIVAVLTEDCDSAKKAVFAAEAVADEYFTDETARSPEKGQIRANSAMPCDDPDSFAAWYATYEEESDEPSTTEEARPEPVREDHEDVRTEELTLVTETEAPVESASPVIYRIAGETIDESIQVRLYQHLQAAGIPYWYEGALCQMFQESHGQQYAVNPNNGIDCGLYQYRSTFWTEPVDIFDIDAQLRRYASDMAARFNSGLSVDEAISRHNTSDSVIAVNWEYVGQVKQWLGQMEVIR